MNLLDNLEQDMSDMPTRWGSRGSRNFTINFLKYPKVAALIVESAEQARRDQLRRWGLNPNKPWSPRCQVYFYPTTAIMDRMTAGTTTTASAHAPALRLSKGKLRQRKLKLAADDRGLFEDTLPHELSHLIVAELLAPKRPPLWANEGLAMLHESKRTKIRYARGLLHRLSRGQRLFHPRVLFALKSYPDQKSLFYRQSLATIAALVRRNPKKILNFLRDGGNLAALKRHYGLGATALETELLAITRRLAGTR